MTRTLSRRVMAAAMLVVCALAYGCVATEASESESSEPTRVHELVGIWRCIAEWTDGHRCDIYVNDKQHYEVVALSGTQIQIFTVCDEDGESGIVLKGERTPWLPLEVLGRRVTRPGRVRAMGAISEDNLQLDITEFIPTGTGDETVSIRVVLQKQNLVSD